MHLARTDVRELRVWALHRTEGTDEPLDRLHHRAFEVERASDGSRVLDGFPHEQTRRTARAQLRITAAQQVVRGVLVPHEIHPGVNRA